jgi:hypothetical protein
VRGNVLLARAAYAAMTVASRSPWIALPAARVLRHGVVLDERTDLVIEGYPRSGNSFAVAAFTAAQPGEVRVAHHTHAPAHVLAAVRRCVPTLLVLRDPDEAVVEFALAKPAIGVTWALRAYVRFHEPLLPVADGLVVGPFPEVTGAFGAVIERVNRRFGTSFAAFVHSEEADRAVREAIGEYFRGRSGPGLPVVGRTREARPARDAREATVAAYQARGLAPLRRRARRLFERLASLGA